MGNVDIISVELFESARLVLVSTSVMSQAVRKNTHIHGHYVIFIIQKQGSKQTTPPLP